MLNMDGTKTDTGSWKKLKILGSGGFGQVTLWYHSVTGQKIAIKKLHELITNTKDANIKTKQTERWCKEVEIMKKLNHTNIVATLEVPEELKISGPLPVLAMEYCSQGDLRQVLNQPENCCGLREPEILNILRDISNGLAYLHSCKIIHRDLKPDNVVLQEKDSRVIYKLIDLGYAKELDQNSLSKSFVGTIQYIAPELFLGKAYTSSVDYWSFGLLTHEIITGYRPFLPGFSPSDWMKQIQNKPRNIISVMEIANGDVVFSSNISRKNHLSRCFLEDMEKWLRLALDWDGQTRGRDLERNRPVIFEELANIVSKKVIKVFSVPTYRMLSYEVDAETDVLTLRHRLKEDTNLNEDEQLLLLPNGKALSMKGSLMNSLKNEKLDRQGVNLFLYNCGRIEIQSSATARPKFVQELVESANQLLKWRHLKRSCADSVYFLQMEANSYRNLLQGIRVKINSVKQKTLAIESLYEDVEEEWTQVENFSQFLSISHKTDLECYIYYRKIGKLKSSPAVRKWIQNVIDVDRKVTELKNSFNRSEQKKLLQIARQRCRNLDSHPGNEVAQKIPLDDIVTEGQKLWDKIQKMPKEDRDVLMSNASAVNLIKRSSEETSKLVQSQLLQSLFSKIFEADESLARFLSHLTTLLKSTKILRLLIENTQKERQREVWNLIGTAKESNEDENSIVMSASVLQPAFKIHKTNGDSLKSGDFVYERNDRPEPLGGNSDNVCDLKMKESAGSELSLQDDQDTVSIINDNNQLRYRIQDVQQSCRKMVEDFRSLNWDFIEES